ncbi:MAG: endonuclease/exonuclease/phosphatase family protein [Anaerolineae bacterium]
MADNAPVLIRLIVALLNLTVVFTVVIGLLGLVTGNALPLVALLNDFLHWGLLLPLVMLPVMVGLRRPIEAGIKGAGALLFAALYGPLFLPNRAVPEADLTLRVATFNMGDQLTDGRSVVAFIQEEDLDIIAVQELGEQQAQTLRDALSETYHLALYPAGIPGTGVISRYPIVEADLLYFVNPALPHAAVTIDVDGRDVSVYSMHPPPALWFQPGFPPIVYRSAQRYGDVQALVERLGPGPVIVMGDFNATEHSADWQLLREAGLRDAFWEQGTGFGMTFPQGGRYRGLDIPARLVRIDYVWASDVFIVQDAWVGPDLGSDHMPVLAELGWP